MAVVNWGVEIAKMGVAIADRGVEIAAPFYFWSPAWELGILSLLV